MKEKWRIVYTAIIAGALTICTLLVAWATPHTFTWVWFLLSAYIFNGILIWLITFPHSMIEGFLTIFLWLPGLWSEKLIDWIQKWW